MNSNKFFLIFMLFMVFLCFSTVNASEDLNETSISEDNMLEEISSQPVSIAEADQISYANASDSVLDTADENELESNTVCDEKIQKTITPSGKTFSSIETAIDGAKKGDIISLSGTYTGNGNSINIEKDITIQAQSGKATLDAKFLSGFIHTEKNIVLKNLIFKNSGGIFGIASYGNCTIINCIFENNNVTCVSADGSGSSYITTIENSVFKNNYVNAILVQNQNLKVINSEFDNNTEGAIHYYDTNAFITNFQILNSSFTNNKDFGGIYAIVNYGSHVIKGCEFENNYAINGGAFSIRHVYDSNNKFTNIASISVLNCSFINNTASTNSAIELYCDNPSLSELKNNLFINNRITDNQYYEGIEGLGDFSFGIAAENNTVKSKAASSDINMKVTSTPVYYRDALNIKLSDSKGKPLSGKKILVEVKKLDSLDYPSEYFVTTNAKGVAEFTFPKGVGIYNIRLIAYAGSKSVSSLRDVNIKKATAVAAPTKVVTTYGKGKTFIVKITNKNTKKIIKGAKIVIKLKGKTSKTFKVAADLKGIAKIKTSKLPAGSYKVEITSNDKSNMALKLTKSSIKINKVITKVKAPKKTAKFKKSNFFKVTVKDKSTKKPVKSLKLSLKISTGKKVKAFKVKTNSKGVAKFNTYKLTKGNHKVSILSLNNNYKVSAKSSISII